uniref:Uncharacterized protein n=1 Tax=Oryza glaberrima TaxID=4538 RepID=I1PTL2_ORYGL
MRRRLLGALLPSLSAVCGRWRSARRMRRQWAAPRRALEDKGGGTAAGADTAWGGGMAAEVARGVEDNGRWQWDNGKRGSVAALFFRMEATDRPAPSPTVLQHPALWPSAARTSDGDRRRMDLRRQALSATPLLCHSGESFAAAKGNSHLFTATRCTAGVVGPPPPRRSDGAPNSTAGQLLRSCCLSPTQIPHRRWAPAAGYRDLSSV